MAIYHIYPPLPITPTISFHFLLTYPSNLKTFSHRPPSTSGPHRSPPPTLTIFTSSPFFHRHCPLLPPEPPRSSAVSPPSPVFSIWHSNFHRRISPLNPRCRRLDRHRLWHHIITTLITTIATCGKCSLSTTLLSSPRPNQLVSDFPFSFCFNRFNHLFLYSISFERGRMINLLPFSLSIGSLSVPFSSPRFMFNLLPFSLSLALSLPMNHNHTWRKFQSLPCLFHFHRCLFSSHSPSPMLSIPTSPSLLSTSPPPSTASYQPDKQKEPHNFSTRNMPL